MNKKYIVRLSKTERGLLREMVRKGKAAAYKIKHANILLKVDADGPDWSDEETAEAFGCHANTVRNVRQRLVEQGFEAALDRRNESLIGEKRVSDIGRRASIISCRFDIEDQSTGNFRIASPGGGHFSMPVRPSANSARHA